MSNLDGEGRQQIVLHLFISLRLKFSKGEAPGYMNKKDRNLSNLLLQFFPGDAKMLLIVQ